jgi:WD40 repeat protein
VKIWSISSNYEFKLEKVLQGHQRWVWDCAFSADSAYLVTGEAGPGPSLSAVLLMRHKHLLTTQHAYGR